MTTTTICILCGGSGWLSYGETDRDSPRFGQIYLCPRCSDRVDLELSPDYVPLVPGDYGICPHHQAAYTRFKNGRIGHNAGTHDTPMWCMKGGHPPEKQFTEFLKVQVAEGVRLSKWDFGLAWCH